MWVYKGTIEMQISSPFSCSLTGGWGSCAETAVLCFLQFVFIREVPALKSVLIFFFISVN